MCSKHPGVSSNAKQLPQTPGSAVASNPVRLRSRKTAVRACMARATGFATALATAAAGAAAPALGSDHQDLPHGEWERARASICSSYSCDSHKRWAGNETTQQ